MALWLAVAVSACVDRPEENATGEQIYVEICARCHSGDLNGGVGPALDAGSNAASQPDEFLISAITDGIGRMPSFARTLTQGQIERLVEYLRLVQGGT